LLTVSTPEMCPFLLPEDFCSKVNIEGGGWYEHVILSVKN
jgi:hypothetical protein